MSIHYNFRAFQRDIQPKHTVLLPVLDNLIFQIVTSSKFTYELNDYKDTKVPGQTFAELMDNTEPCIEYHLVDKLGTALLLPKSKT